MVTEREEFSHEGKSNQWQYCEGMEVISWRNDVFSYFPPCLLPYAIYTHAVCLALFSLKNNFSSFIFFG